MYVHSGVKRRRIQQRNPFVDDQALDGDDDEEEREEREGREDELVDEDEDFDDEDEGGQVSNGGEDGKYTNVYVT
jgi:hypothetical protein